MTTNNSTSKQFNSELGQGALVPIIFMLFVFVVLLVIASFFLDGNTAPSMDQMESGWNGIINLIDAANVKPF
jgi:hypothetical protein